MNTNRNKKWILIGTAVVLFAGICIYLFSRPEPLGSMTHACTEQETADSDISFTGTAGDKIRFSFRSHIESGSLDVILYNSKGDAVFELGQAKVLKCFFTLPETDTYTLKACRRSFIGDYRVKVFRW